MSAALLVLTAGTLLPPRVVTLQFAFWMSSEAGVTHYTDHRGVYSLLPLTHRRFSLFCGI